MKKLLLALALCSVATPSYSHGSPRYLGSEADHILASGKMLSSTFDAKENIFKFVMFCGVSWETNRSGQLSQTHYYCANTDAKTDPDDNAKIYPKDGIYFCEVYSSGKLSCVSGHDSRDHYHSFSGKTISNKDSKPMIVDHIEILD